MYVSKKHYFNLIYVSAIAFLLGVFFLRLFYNTSFSNPIHVITSGYEDESIFAIWKYVNGQDIYTDFHKMPYAASYFNWGFYIFYGGITKGILALFNLGDEWIPQIGRMITLVGCIMGFVVALKIAKYVVQPAKLSILLLSLPIFFFGGYLMGFWAITVRPDVWALTFELIGLYFFMRYFSEQKIGSLLFSLLFFYIAFSFKQNFISIIGGCILFLAIKSKWKTAITLSVVFAGLVLITYFLGSKDFQYLLVKSQGKMGLYASIGLTNLKLGLLKCLPITLFGGITALFILLKYPVKTVLGIIKSNHYILLLFVCFVVSFPLLFFMSMKAGASDNYFFSPFIVLGLLLVAIVNKLEHKYPFSIGSIYAIICVFTIIEGILIVKGNYGQMNLRYLSEKYEAVKGIAKDMPLPLYVENDNYANLPWINRSKEHFVLATTYYYKDLFGEKFENDGVEGLMQAGYFNSIISIGSKNPDNKNLYLLADSVRGPQQTFFIWKKK